MREAVEEVAKWLHAGDGHDRECGARLLAAHAALLAVLHEQRAELADWRQAGLAAQEQGREPVASDEPDLRVVVVAVLSEYAAHRAALSHMPGRVQDFLTVLDEAARLCRVAGEVRGG